MELLDSMALASPSAEYYSVSYAYYNLNNDSIPELLAKIEYDSTAELRICGYKNNKFEEKFAINYDEAFDDDFNMTFVANLSKGDTGFEEALAEYNSCDEYEIDYRSLRVPLKTHLVKEKQINSP